MVVCLIVVFLSSDVTARDIVDAVECESAKILEQGSVVSTATQNHNYLSRGQHLYVKGDSKGAYVSIRIPAPSQAADPLFLYATRGPKYSIVRISVNGRAVPGEFDLYDTSARQGDPIPLGVHKPRRGVFVLRVEVVGANSSAEGEPTEFALDCLRAGELPAPSEEDESEPLGVEEDPVNRAIDRGLAYLKAEVSRVPVALVDDRNSEGQVALETYALIVAGVSVNDPLIERNFDYLKRTVLKNSNTYALSCYVFALDAAIAQLENDALILAPAKLKERVRDMPSIGKRYRPQLKEAVKMLIKGQHPKGGWRYQPREAYDNSCTQFAVLALAVGAKRRVPVSARTWRQIIDHFVSLQESEGPSVVVELTPADEDARDSVDLQHRDRAGAKKRKGDEKSGRKKGRGGTTVERRKRPIAPWFGEEEVVASSRGWRYLADREPTWSMTCAGLSSLLIAYEEFGGKLKAREREQVLDAIQNGFAYLIEKWQPTNDYYGMYSLEKVGDLGRVAKFGENDWYEVLSGTLLSRQLADGSWPHGTMHGENQRVATAFSLLILRRASALLTSNPASKMVVVTGGHEEEVEIRNRHWVYIPRLKATLHYPTLLRTLRLRPTPKLVEFLDELIVSYPERERPELLLPLVRVREQLPARALRTRLDKAIESIAHVELPTSEKAAEWSRQWETARHIAEHKDPERFDELRSIYEGAGSSVPLKGMAAHAFVATDAKECVPLLVADLGHDLAPVRAIAYSTLADFFVDELPEFDPEGLAEDRASQADAVREWVAKRS